MTFDLETLADFAGTGGVAGHEGQVRKTVREAFVDAGLEDIRTDPMGNLVGSQPGLVDSDRRIAVAAHLDEIGFLVRHIEDGFLALDPVGAWNPDAIAPARVTVHTADGALPGVIGVKPPHILEDDEERIEVKDVRVDLGLSQETVEERIAVGDPVTMRTPIEQVGEHVVGKALDDRLPLALMTQVAARVDPAVSVEYIATTQEEVGLRGATALADNLDVDCAIALDVTVANDVPGADAADRITALGDGVAIKIKDGSAIASGSVVDRLRSVAAAADIPTQPEVMSGLGSDTAQLQRGGGGRPTGALSLPTRYLHSATESAHVEDIEAMVSLLRAFLTQDPVTHDYHP